VTTLIAVDASNHGEERLASRLAPLACHRMDREAPR
jgi:hypothetical protein